jgi:hypothetical protein
MPQAASGVDCANCPTLESGSLDLIPFPDGRKLCEPCAAAECHACDECGQLIHPAHQERQAIAWVGGEGYAFHSFCAPVAILRCAWWACQYYGGPEEGGWYYEAGGLLGAVPVLLPWNSPEDAIGREATLTEAHLQAADELMTKAFSFEKAPDNRKLTLEWEMPELTYPKKKPHYE